MRRVNTINDVMLLAINFSSDDDKENLQQYIDSDLPAMVYKNTENMIFKMAEHGFENTKSAIEASVGKYEDLSEILVTLVEVLDDADHPGGYFCIYNKSTKESMAFYISEDLDEKCIALELIDVQH